MANTAGPKGYTRKYQQPRQAENSDDTSKALKLIGAGALGSFLGRPREGII